MALLSAEFGLEFGDEVILMVLNDLDLWAEIEGFPYAFGLNERAASWFSGRGDSSARLGIKGVLAQIPAGVEAEARPLEGTSSVGSYTLDLVDDGSGLLRQLLASTQRRDGWLRLAGTPDITKPLPTWQANTSYPAGFKIQ